MKKFGGTSINNINLLKDIIGCRDIVVVSAPGKRDEDDKKVTDLLDMIYFNLKNKKPFEDYWAIVKDRFRALVLATKVEIDLYNIFKDIEKCFSKDVSRDFLLSRGEYLSALIISKAFDMNFVDAKDIIQFKNGILDVESSIPLIKKMVVANTVVPGFYGSEKGEIKLLSRGGSDVTGAVIAKALKSKEYQNFNDQDGVKIALPKYIKNSHKIDCISFDNMYEYARSGANILHPESIKIAKESDIPINVKYTFSPTNAGTIIHNKDENRIIKALGANEFVYKIAIDKFLLFNNYDKIVRFLNSQGLEYQTFVEMDNNFDIYCLSKSIKKDIQQLKTDFQQIFHSKLDVKLASEVLLITGNLNSTKVMYNKLNKYLKEKKYNNVDLIALKNTIALVVEPKDLEFFYKEIYADFVDSCINVL